MWLFIAIITIAVSVYAMQDRALIEKLSLKPMLVYQKLQVHRIFSHSLVHADWSHLLMNMFVLYSFGPVCEKYLSFYFNIPSNIHFLGFYLLGLIFSSLYSVFKYRNNYQYSAIGASGAVMSVVFLTIFFDPWGKIFFFFFPLPGIIFAALYLAYSIYMGRKNQDNIGHDAHFSGALFGLIYPVIAKPQLIFEFINNLMHP